MYINLNSTQRPAATPELNRSKYETAPSHQSTKIGGEAIDAEIHQPQETTTIILGREQRHIFHFAGSPNHLHDFEVFFACFPSLDPFSS